MSLIPVVISKAVRIQRPTAMAAVLSVCNLSSLRSPSAKDKEADCAKDFASYSKVSYKGAIRKMSIIKKYLEDLESRID